MDIILINRARGHTRKLRVQPWLRATLVLVPILALAASAWLGYRLAPGPSSMVRVAEATELGTRQLQAQRQEIEALRQRVDDNVHAFAQRLGRLQAHVTRLDAVGLRMTQMAELDSDEFDFGNPPPVGGPEGEPAADAPTLAEFNAELDRFEHVLNARERQMNVLRDLMAAGELRDEVMPSGRPITSGWMSSGYGWRTDPFNGRRVVHQGIDFAGGMGAEVVSVAAGVVSHADTHHGYGTLVEVNHGNGYVTRYGHNRKVLVEVGERVEKGQVIAEMGSTGRSTGPHVHFEVLHNGKIVNPTEYIRAAR